MRHSGPTRGFYRRRNPCASPLWQLADHFYDEFEAEYPGRYAAGYGYWRPAIGRAVSKFLKCGDLHEGFARVRCGDCGQDYSGTIVASGGVRIETILRFDIGLDKYTLEDDRGKMKSYDVLSLTPYYDDPVHDRHKEAFATLYRKALEANPDVIAYLTSHWRGVSPTLLMRRIRRG